MDLAETMKQVLSSSKGASGSGGSSSASASALNSAVMHSLQQHQQQQSDAAAAQQLSASGGGVGYVTEKLYMLLQLFLQNKGWTPSIEMLQCYTELKDSALLPNAAYLQVLANRMALDSQGRLILRDSGKIVLPYEHFANAVMLKHMTGPHGLHLSVDATVRAVMDSYTIGREAFGMEKEFIIEVVQSCPNPACRYYKNHMGMGAPFMDPTYQAAAQQITPDFMQHLPHMAAAAAAASAAAAVDLTQLDVNKSVQQQAAAVNMVSRHVDKHVKSLQSQQQQAAHQQAQQQAAHQQAQQQAREAAAAQQAQQAAAAQQAQQAAAAAAAALAQQQQQQQQQRQEQQQQQITAAIIQQQNRAIAQQNLEKFGNLSAIEKQRVLQQLDKKHFEVAAAVAHSASSLNIPQPSVTIDRVVHDRSATNTSSVPSHLPTVQTPSLSDHQQQPSQQQQSQHQHQAPQPHQPPQQQQQHHKVSDILRVGNGSSGSSAGGSSSGSSSNNSSNNTTPTVDLTDSLSSNKDLLALHNGAWGGAETRDNTVGQEKIIRAFSELMRNMTRMKTFIRPSMCKPYGKQSESLQKTLIDTIQLVQSLRSCLPAPHIPVNSWKSEDRHL